MNQVVLPRDWPPDRRTWDLVLTMLERLSAFRPAAPLVGGWTSEGLYLATDREEGFWAKITTQGTNGSYSWEMLIPADGKVRTVPNPTFGTAEGVSGGPSNPAYVAAESPPAVRVPVGAVVWMWPGALGAGYQQFLFAPTSGHLNGVTCVGPLVTNVRCVSNRLVVTFKYLRIDWSVPTAQLVDTCTSEPNPNVGPFFATGGGDGTSTAPGVWFGAGVGTANGTSTAVGDAGPSTDPGGDPIVTSSLLLEDGFHILTEDGGYLLLE